MRKCVLFVFLFISTICFNNIYLFADSEQLAEPEQEQLVDTSQISEAPNDETGIKAESYDDDFDAVDEDFASSSVIIKDSMPSFNRSMFSFNDKLYYHVVKPGNKGYNYIVPKAARKSIRKMFDNILFPGRFLNCIFQGKFKGAGTEMARFILNTSIGLVGMFDPADKLFNLQMQDEDFGQTLAKYGMKNGTFITWPGLGPSSVRDTIGFIGDIAMNPLTFVSLFVTPFASLGRPYDTFNDFALDEGAMYESIVESSVDPYIAIQHAYVQNRQKKIEE
ncbi:MAG: MlaA family lipoprotein [Candidatus Anammoxibacter sp.]